MLHGLELRGRGEQVLQVPTPARRVVAAAQLARRGPIEHGLDALAHPRGGFGLAGPDRFERLDDVPGFDLGDGQRQQLGAGDGGLVELEPGQAAGASMVAEVVPENRRVEAGALLYTAAPMGLFLATYVNFGVAGVWMADSPETSWRYVFLFGLVPAGVAFLVRLFLKEPERWKEAVKDAAPVRLAEIFSPELRHITFAGVCMSLVALIAWWSCNAFIPTVATGLAQNAAAADGLDTTATLALVEEWKFRATYWFNTNKRSNSRHDTKV